MIIEVKASSPGQAIQPWTILELQGALSGAQSAKDLAGQTLGRVLQRSDGKPILEVSHTHVGECRARQQAQSAL